MWSSATTGPESPGPLALTPALSRKRERGYVEQRHHRAGKVFSLAPLAGRGLG